MGKYTKWILAGLGWSIGGPIGGLLGYILGSAFSSGKKLGNSYSDSNAWTSSNSASRHHGPYRNTGTQQDVNVALMVLIAAVMKADGQVKRSELDYVKRFLLTNYGEQRGKEMLKALQRLVEQPIPVESVCQQIKVNTDYNTRYHMLDFLFGIGGADGLLDASEIAVLHRISTNLGIAANDYVSIFERHSGTSYSGSYSWSDSRHRSSGSSSTGNYSKDPYRVLGIDSSATDDEVRKAYRRMAMKYHPDRVAGMSEEIQRNAAEQMKEINQAYEVIKQRRDSLK